MDEAPQQQPPSLPTPLPPPAPNPAPADARTFAMLSHLSAFAGLIVPLGNIWGPLVIWLIKKDAIPEVDAHAKESLNFQISITIYMIVSAILIIVLIGILLLIALSIFWIVVVIVASVRANAGEFFRYPLAIRFIT